jgi:uncharacterized alkaline shock family protein YloU
MNSPTQSSSTQKSQGSSARGSTGGEVAGREQAGPLASSKGRTLIADVVVQKIAGMATREVSGVRDLGGGTSRTFGALRERIPGASASHGRGVSVEVGERQAAVDLEMLIDYGVAIPDLARAVRGNVITALERMTGLDVVEVNINVSDIYLGDEDEGESGAQTQTRVQ